MIETDRIQRRVLREDRIHGVTITYNDYPPVTGNSKIGITHKGFEYGLVLEGELTIESTVCRACLAAETSLA